MSGCSAARNRAAFLAAIIPALTSCATTYRCDGEVKVRVQDRAVVVECPSGPAPTVTVTTTGKVTGP